MVRLPCFLLTAILCLTACGGGGGGGAGSRGNTTLKSTSDFRNKYTGITSRAVVSADNFWQFFETLFSTAEGAGGPSNAVQMKSGQGSGRKDEPQGSQPLLNKLGPLMHHTVTHSSDRQLPAEDANYQIQNIRVDETELCDNGGSLTTKGLLKDDQTGGLELLYANCLLDGVLLNGKAGLEITQAQIMSTYDQTFYFYDLDMTENGVRYRLYGSLKFEQPGSCENERSTTNLVMTNAATGVQYMFENLVTREFANCPIRHELTSGRIFHSTYGYVDVGTPVELVYEDFENSDFPDRKGVIEFAGANGSVARFSVFEDVVFEFSTIDQKLYLSHLQIDSDGDSLYELDLMLRLQDFGAGAASSLNDSDGDDMPDGWETVNGFDINDPADRDLDADGDGFSNLLEYRHHGDPRDELSRPLVTDLSLAFGAAPTNVRAGREATISLSALNPNAQYGAQEVSMIVTKSDNAVWVSPPCPQTGNQLVCSFEHITNGSGRGVSLTLIADDPGDVSLSASVTTRTFDNDLSNNQATAVIAIHPREVDLMVELDELFHAAVIGQPRQFAIEVTNVESPFDEARQMTLTVDLPSHVNATAATYITRGFDSTQGTCDVAGDIVCNMGSSSFGADILVTVSGVTPGETGYTARIQSAGIDTDPANDQVSAPLFVGHDASAIQALIDSADDGDTVTVPAGYYVGGFNAIGRNLDLVGTDARLFLLNPPALSGAGTDIYIDGDTTLSDFYFTGNGEVNLGGNNVVRDSIFDNARIDAFAPGSAPATITIAGNIFRNSPGCFTFGFGYLVRVLGSASSIIENNIFENNPRCISVLAALGFFEADPGISHRIVNNTFFNNGRAIHITQRAESSEQIIQNNLFVQNEVAVRLDENTWSGDPLEYPVVRNNLGFENLAGYVLVTGAGNVEQDFIGFDRNIAGDPLFGNSALGDYRLSAGSPAIDAGENMLAPVADFDGDARPVDGDLDGISHSDIGAFEFQ